MGHYKVEGKQPRADEIIGKGRPDPKIRLVQSVIHFTTFELEKIDSPAQFHAPRLFSGQQFLSKPMHCPALGFTRESEELLTGEEARIGDY